MFGKKRPITDESQVRALERAFRSRGVTVRREKLARGSAFKVKSGGCLLSGEKIIFVDRRLGDDQQLGILLEYVVDLALGLDEKELAQLSPRTRESLLAQLASAEHRGLNGLAESHTE